MTPTYRISQCFVLHLDAGRDPVDGSNRRRVFVLGDCNTGRVLAAVPNEGGEYESMLDLVSAFELEGPPDLVARLLLTKAGGERVRIAPSHRSHLLRREALQRSTPARARLE